MKKKELTCFPYELMKGWGLGQILCWYRAPRASGFTFNLARHSARTLNRRSALRMYKAVRRLIAGGKCLQVAIVEVHTLVERFHAQTLIAAMGAHVVHIDGHTR